jgi:hypothetical protein
VIIGEQALGNREILDIKAAAIYLGVSRSHLSHILAGKVAGVPAIPHVRAGRRALIRRTVIDRWLLEQEHGAATSVPPMIRSNHPESTPAPHKENS